MPYVRRRIKHKKTTYKRKSKKSSKQLTIGGFREKTSIPRGIFPISIMKKLRYVDTITLNPSSVALALHAFRANSIYDPDYTGTGHQPRGTDNIMPTLYNHYTVVGSKMVARYIPEVAKSTNSLPMYFFSTLATTANPLTAETPDSTIFESAMIKNKVVIRGGDDGNTRKFPTITNTFSAKKFFRAKSIVGVSPYRATYNENPTEEAFFTLYGMDISGGDPPAYSIEVTIDYFVVFTEPNNFAIS